MICFCSILHNHGVFFAPEIGAIFMGPSISDALLYPTLIYSYSPLSLSLTHTHKHSLIHTKKNHTHTLSLSLFVFECECVWLAVVHFRYFKDSLRKERAIVNSCLIKACPITIFGHLKTCLLLVVGFLTQKPIKKYGQQIF